MKATETLFDVLSEQIDFSSKTKYNWMKNETLDERGSYEII